MGDIEKIIIIKRKKRLIEHIIEAIISMILTIIWIYIAWLLYMDIYPFK